MNLRPDSENNIDGPATAKVSRIAVLGAGTMGHGVAQVAAAAGYDVVARPKFCGAWSAKISSAKKAAKAFTNGTRQNQGRGLILLDQKCELTNKR